MSEQKKLAFWFDIKKSGNRPNVSKLDQIDILATTHIRIKMDLDLINRPDTTQLASVKVSSKSYSNSLCSKVQLYSPPVYQK